MKLTGAVRQRRVQADEDVAAADVWMPTSS